MLISVETGRTMTFTQNFIIILFFCITSTWTRSQGGFGSNDLIESDYGEKLQDKNDVYLTQFKDILDHKEGVLIQVFYESHCPHCITFFLKQLAPVLETMTPYLLILPYPFGNAKIIYDKSSLKVKCQNGPDECYGNKLHACAIDSLGLNTAVQYNICLMNSTVGLGSDDEAADRCGKSIDVDPEPIKACAKGLRGMELLITFGIESEEYNFAHVPYVRIDGKESKSDDFKSHVCAAFRHPPPPCK